MVFRFVKLVKRRWRDCVAGSLYDAVSAHASEHDALQATWDRLYGKVQAAQNKRDAVRFDGNRAGASGGTTRC